MTLEPRPAARVMDAVTEDTAFSLGAAPAKVLKAVSRNGHHANSRETPQLAEVSLKGFAKRRKLLAPNKGNLDCASMRQWNKIPSSL